MNPLSYLDQALNRLFTPLETRIHPSQVTDEWLKSLGLVVGTTAGADISESNALQITTVYACVRVLSESIASLPLILYGRLPRGKERAVNHPLYPLLHDLPNPEMTSYDLKSTLMGHLGVRGNAYAEIERNNAGRVIGIWPLPADRTKPKRVNKQLFYEMQLPEGETVTLPKSRVMHIHGLGFDGLIGYSPVALAREAMGLSKATEQYGASFFGSGARPSGVLTYPGVLADKAKKNLRESWETEHKGLENAQRIAILEEGLGYQQLGIAPEDAQFLETRKFQRTEIAGLYRIPPHMVGDLDRATFSNIEQQSLEFVIYTLLPWLTNWEQAIYRDLLSEPERKQYFAQFLVDALLRGDDAARWEAYTKAIGWGVFSINQVLEKENMNPIEGGDVHLVPLNMIPLDQIAAMPEPEQAPTSDDLQQQRDLERCEVCGDFHDPNEKFEPDNWVTPGHWTRAIDESGVMNRPGKIKRLDNPPETRARNVARSRSRLAGSYKKVFKREAERTIKREVSDVRKAIKSHFGERSTRDLGTFFTWLQMFYIDHIEIWRSNILPILLNYADVIGIDVGQELGVEPLTARDIDAFIQRYAENMAKSEVASSQGQLEALIRDAINAGEDPVPLVETRLDEWLERRPDKIADAESHAALYGAVVAFYGYSRIVNKIMWVANGDTCPYCSDLDGRIVGIEEVFVGKDTDFQPEGAEAPMRRGSDTTHPPLHNGCDCGLVASI